MVTQVTAKVANSYSPRMIKHEYYYLYINAETDRLLSCMFLILIKYTMYFTLWVYIV